MSLLSRESYERIGQYSPLQQLAFVTFAEFEPI